MVIGVNNVVVFFALFALLYVQRGVLFVVSGRASVEDEFVRLRMAIPLTRNAGAARAMNAAIDIRFTRISLALGLA